MFTTERLRLRAYQSSDFEPLFALYSDPQVFPWMAVENYVVPKTEDNFRKGTLPFFLGCLMCCIAEELETGAFVGVAVLFQSGGQNANRNVSFGISLNSRSQNKGYGKEITRFMVDYAFRNLNMHRVSLAVFSSNEKAIQVYRKIGFVEEARVRKYIWLDGEWQDRLKMGILEEEWSTRAQS